MDTTRIDGQKMDLHPRNVVQQLNGMNDWEKVRHIYPIYVEVSPVGVCNHECSFCSVDYMLDRRDGPRLSYEALKRTIMEMAGNGVKSMMFAGCGEPLLYKDPETKRNLSNIILVADAAGLDTAITTNAVLLTREIAKRAFTARGLKWIRTSINGGDAETYEAIHRAKPGDFEKVLKNLEVAVEVREKMGSKVKFLGQIVVVPEVSGPRRKSLIHESIPSNLHTVLRLAQRLRDIGVDNLSVKPFKQHTVELEMTRSAMYDKQRLDYDAFNELFEELRAMETEGFEVTVRRQAMDQQVTDDRGYETCYSTPYHWAYLEADGEIWGCSAHIGRIENGKEIGDHRFRFGNVNEQTFTEIWQGERRKACWEYTRNAPCDGGLDVSKCMKGCQMDMPNVYLSRLMHPEPTDNFVK